MTIRHDDQVALKHRVDMPFLLDEDVAGPDPHGMQQQLVHVVVIDEPTLDVQNQGRLVLGRGRNGAIH